MENSDWTEIVASNDAEAIWNAIYHLVGSSSTLGLLKYHGCSFENLSIEEINSDIAQEVFLDLLRRDRFSYFIANNYTSRQIEDEILLNELPRILISRTRTASSADPVEHDRYQPLYPRTVMGYKA